MPENNEEPDILYEDSHEYRRIYKDIVSDRNEYRFTTVSPPYSPDYLDVYNIFKTIMIKFKCRFSLLLGNVEITDNQRIHFHMVYHMSDMNNYYFLNKGFRALGWNTLCVHSQPKKGYDYLFKQNMEGYRINDSKYTLETVYRWHAEHKEEKKKKKLSNLDKMTALAPTYIPLCWRIGGEAEEDPGYSTAEPEGQEL